MSKIEVKRIVGSGFHGTVAVVEVDGVEFMLKLEKSGSVHEIQRQLERGGFEIDHIREAVHADTKYQDEVLIELEEVDIDEPASLPSSPPRVAELLFSLFASKRTVEAQLGDMQEIFERRVKTHGNARARMLYWAQVVRAIGPNVWRLVRKWGVIGILIDYGRSKLGL